MAIVFFTPAAFTQNNTQPPEWVSSGRHLTYVLERDSNGFTVMLYVELPCQLQDSTLNLQGNEGEFAAKVNVNSCSSKGQAKEMTIDKIIIQFAPNVGVFNTLDSLPPLSVKLQAFLVFSASWAEIANGTIHPVRPQTIDLPAYYYMSGQQLLYGVPSNAEGKFLWSEDSDGKIEIHFSASDRWHNQFFFAPFGPSGKK